VIAERSNLFRAFLFGLRGEVLDQFLRITRGTRHLDLLARPPTGLDMGNQRREAGVVADHIERDRTLGLAVIFAEIVGEVKIQVVRLTSLQLNNDHVDRPVVFRFREVQFGLLCAKKHDNPLVLGEIDLTKVPYVFVIDESPFHHSMPLTGTKKNLSVFTEIA